MSLGPVSRLTAILLVLPACDPGDSPIDSDDSVSSDTGTIQECGLVEAPSYPGCLVLMYDDLMGYGRRPDEHRMLYDSHGLLQSYDFRSALDSEDFEVCGYSWTARQQPMEEWCVGLSVYTYQWGYDASGFVSTKSYDGASDGEIDKVWHYQVEGDGQVIEEALDQDMDGTYDSYIWYTYDENDRLKSDAWDYQGDDVADYIRQYEYDTDGHLVAVRIDSNADGIDDEELSYAYDEFGNILQASIDDGVDGQWDEQTDHRYEDCRLTESSQRELSGVSSSIGYVYNSEGRLFRADYDWDDDGDRDAFASWEYTCP